MSKKLAGFLFACLLCSHTFAQKSSIKGVVAGQDNKPLDNAPVMVLQAKDSVMVSYTRSDNEGKFALKNLSDTARFILFFTYPQYVAFTYKVDMRDAKEGIMEVGKITMPLKAILLQEVLIKSKTAAIKIKGDTTEYDAGSFKVRPNATVEELLKQLPGLQIDQKGNITAQGQKVKKVLVDGEEFFSDDPTLVTRNFRADMIDKVQVYDKKSDAAAFTGIDDGVKDKTINLKIKEDKNHGLFGKTEVGGGPDYYDGVGMINYFKGKKRMSVYGTASNTGNSGLGFGDKMKLGTLDNFNNGYTFYYDANKGLPSVITGGAHFDQKWNHDKSAINGTYSFSRNNTRGDESVRSQNNLPTGIILSNSNSRFSSSNFSQRVIAHFTQKLDTTFTFRTYFNGSVTDNQYRSNSTKENRREDQSRMFDNRASNDNNDLQHSYNLKLQWEKKFRKKGRTLSFYVDNTFKKNTTHGESLSTSQFFDTKNKPERLEVLNLRKEVNAHWNDLSFRTVYTEPLSKKLALAFNYELAANGGKDDRRSYTINEQAKPALNTAFSTLMNAASKGYQGGLSLNYSSSKVNWGVGNNLGIAEMKMESLYDTLTLKKQFTNWNPSANVWYKVTQYKTVGFNYSGRNVNPERSQFIPFKDNNSQLSAYIANPALKSSYTNNFSLYYHSSQVVSNSYFFIGADYTLISNPIVPANSVNPAGIYTYRNINMSGYTNSNYFLWSNYSSKIKVLDLSTSVELKLNGGKTFSPINNAINELNYNSPSFSINIGKEKEKKYSFYMYGNLGYTFNKSSLQPDIRNNYFHYTLRPNARIYLFKKWEIHTDAEYFWQQKSQAFNNNFNRLIWNGGIGRKLLKNDQLTLSLSCHDLLNQNNGISRSADNTFYSENRFSIIQRFFLINASWNFNKFFTSKQ